MRLQLWVLSLLGGCKGSSESTLVKMSNCWKPHAAAQLIQRGEKICSCLFMTFISKMINEPQHEISNNLTF